LAHVCQALPFLIVIWMYFLIQVINSAFERGRETKKLNFCQWSNTTFWLLITK
jgi:hypothetical protein